MIPRIESFTLDWDPRLLLLAFIVLGIGVGIVVHLVFMRFSKWLARRDWLAEHHEIASHFIGVVGVIYAVLVAFVVVTAWQAHDRAQELTIQEQHNVDDLFHLDAAYHDSSDAKYPDRNAESVRRMLREYVMVMGEEWRQMKEEELLCFDTAAVSQACQSGGASTLANDLAHCIRERTFSLSPTTLREQIIYQEGIRLVQSFSENREEIRLHYQEPTLHTNLWWSFLLGALILAGMTYTIRGQDSRSQLFRMCALFAMIGMLVALALVFDRPFSGSQQISGKAWTVMLTHFDGDLDRDATPKGGLPPMCSD